MFPGVRGITVCVIRGGDFSCQDICGYFLQGGGDIKRAKRVVSIIKEKRDLKESGTEKYHRLIKN
jgi:hypothetical protein